MSSLGKGEMISQGKMADRATVGARPTGDIIYVSPTNGNAGNDGKSRLHPTNTLARGIALASAGDTIILEPGGSESVTATTTVAKADLKIVCPCDSPRGGYILTGAGTIDLLTVTAADVHIEGIQFVHSGSTANASGILASSATSRMVVKNCIFDNLAASTKTGLGIEATAGADDQVIDGCMFLDTKYGVQIVASSANVSDRTIVKNSTFFVGGTEFYGIYAAAGTGAVQGIQVLDCIFIEADGSGAVATTAWDGTSQTDGTQGPISFGANVDQYLIQGCTASTALSVIFNYTCTINAGAAGEIVDCHTATGSGDLTTIASDTAAIETAVAGLQVEVSGTAGIATWKSSAAPGDGVSMSEALRAVYDDTNQVSSDTAKIEEDTNELQGDWANGGRLDLIQDTIASDAVEIYSDTTTIESDCAKIEADTNELQTDWQNGGRLDLIQDTIASDVVLVYSDTTVIASDLVLVYSDTAAINTQTTTIASDLVLVYSDTTVIASDLVLIYSDTAAINTQTTTIASDAVLIYSDTTAIHSDTTAIHSQTTVIEGAVVLLSGTADSGSTTTIVDAAGLAQDDNDYWKGSYVHITSGTSAGQVRLITGFAEATDTLTFAPALTQAITTNTYEILPGAGVNGGVVSDIYSDTTVIASDIAVMDSWDVRTVVKADLALDGDDVDDVFTIGGPIELIGLCAFVTEAVSAHNCEMQWSIDPGVGASNTPLCAVLDIISVTLGSTLYIDGTSTNALINGVNGTATGLMCDKSVFLPAGGIDLELQNSDPTSGIASVYLTYRPLTATSTVTAKA